MSRCMPVAILCGILVTACSADDATRPNSALPEFRSSTSQGLTRAKQVGDPILRPGDFHLFSAALGGFDNGFAEFFAMGGRLLPPPEHIVLPSLAVVNGTPHAGPYDEELAKGGSGERPRGPPRISGRGVLHRIAEPDLLDSDAGTRSGCNRSLP